MPPNRRLLRCGRAEVHVPSLARHNKMAAGAMDEGGSAETRAETNNKLDAGFLLIGANRRRPSKFQDRQAERLSFKIIEKQASETGFCGDRGAVNAPIRVGQFDGAPADRTSGASDQAARLAIERGKYRRECVFERRKIMGFEARPCLERDAGLRCKSKPRIGAADVADENRKWKLHAIGLSDWRF